MADAPDFDLTFGTTTLSGADKLAVYAVEADLSLNMPDRFEVRLLDTSGELADDTRFAFGTKMTVKMGYEGALTTVGVGAIARTETTLSKQGRDMLIIGYGGRYVLQKQVSARAFTDTSTTIGDKLGKAVTGLTPDLTTSGSATKLDYLMQGGQSTGRFVEEYASREGQVIVGEDGNVNLTAPKLTTAVRTLTWEEDVLDLRLEVNTFQQVSEVKVSGVDIKTKKPIVGTATEAQVLDKMGGSKTGSAVAEAAFGASVLEVSDMPVHTQDEADALAKALLNDRLFRFVTGTGVVRGDASLKAGAVVELDRFASRLNGKYYLTRVIHSYVPRSGYVSRFQLCRPAIGA